MVALDAIKTDAAGNCINCERAVMVHRHGLTRPLASGLTALYNAGGGPLNIGGLELSRNLWDNFQKLKYHGLIVQHFEKGTRKRGWWSITDLGRHFVAGRVALPHAVWTLFDEPLTPQGPTKNIFIHEAVGGFEKYEDYAAAAIRVINP